MTNRHRSIHPNFRPHLMQGWSTDFIPKLAEQSPAGTNIPCMLPDTGERYQSTALFEDVIANMNEAEIEISCSTSGYRFDTQLVEEKFLVNQSEDAVERMLRQLKKLRWCGSKISIRLSCFH